MGTPCAIGMKQADGSVRAIRCNYDGYVAGAGVILGGWYTEAAKIEALLAAVLSIINTANWIANMPQSDREQNRNQTLKRLRTEKKVDIRLEKSAFGCTL